MVGTTMASMIASASSSIVRLAAPMGPAGDSTASCSHPASANGTSSAHNERNKNLLARMPKPFPHWFVVILRDQRHLRQKRSAILYEVYDTT